MVKCVCHNFYYCNYAQRKLCQKYFCGILLAYLGDCETFMRKQFLKKAPLWMFDRFFNTPQKFSKYSETLRTGYAKGKEVLML